MSKYNHVRTLKKVKARVRDICYKCRNQILPGDYYYGEYIEDKFLHRLHAKKYCSGCYQKYGSNLLRLHKKPTTGQNAKQMNGQEQLGFWPSRSERQ